MKAAVSSIFLTRVARHPGWTSAVKGVNSSHLTSSRTWSPVRRSFHARPRWVDSLGLFVTRWAPGPLVRLMQLADALRVRSWVYWLGSISRECVGYAFGLQSCLIQAVAGREEIYSRPSDPFLFVCLWRHDIISCFFGVKLA